MNKMRWPETVSAAALLAGLSAIPVAAHAADAQNGQVAATEVPADGAQAARAQDGQVATRETPDTADIVVTALKRGVRLQDVPAAISALQPEALDRLGINSIETLSRNVPSLNFTNFGGAEVYINLRGLSSGYGLSPAVSLYVDDTPMDFRSDAYAGATVIEPYDLERIEVLRGPQGTLLGSSSLGGAIRLVTAKPSFSGTDVFGETSVSDTKGGNVSYAFNGGLNLPLSDNLAVRVVATHRRDGGWIDRSGATNFFDPDPNAPITARNENNSTTTSVRATLRYEPDATLSITPSFIYQRSETEGRPGYTVELGQFVRQHNFLDTGTFETKIASLRIEKQFDAFSLVSASSYVDKSTRFLDDYTDFGQRLGAIFGEPELYVPVTLDVPVKYKQFAQEIRLVSRGDGPLRWIVGGYFNHTRQTNQNFMRSADFVQFLGTDAIYTYSAPNTDRQIAGFGELTWLPIKQLELTAGLRAYDLRQTMSITQSGFIAGPDQPKTIATASGITKRFTASFRPSRNLNIYGTISEGFRPGGPNAGLAIVPPCSFIDAYRPSFKPDKVRNYEVGTKAQFAGGRVSINAAAYQLDWTGVQGQVNSSCGLFVANVGKARVRGLEFEGTVHPIDILSFSGNLSYTDAKLRSIDSILQAAGVGVPGQSIINVPRWQYGLNAQLEVPTSGEAKLFVQPSWQYVGKADTSYAPPFTPRPAYNNVDLKAGVRFGRYEVAIFAHNLTNELQVYAAGTDAVFGTTSFTVGRPRVIGLSFQLKPK